MAGSQLGFERHGDPLQQVLAVEVSGDGAVDIVVLLTGAPA